MVRLIAFLALFLATPVVAASERPAIGKIVRFERAVVYLPQAAQASKVPLLVILPGTGGRPDPMIRALKASAEAAGFALIGFSPTGGDGNFDTVDRFFDDREARRKEAWVNWPEPTFGADKAHIVQTIDALTAIAPIDPQRIGLLGHSHGGSFALSLGLSEPTRFRSIAALSPGILLLPEGVHGGQFLFLAHGKSDAVQPHRRSACIFVPKLEALGYKVRFTDFPGGHELNDPVVREALAHFLAPERVSEPKPQDC